MLQTSINLNELHFEQHHQKFPCCIYHDQRDIYVNAHNEFEILYMLRGSLRLYVDDMLYHIREGEAFVMNSGSVHFGFAEGEAQYFVLLCGDSFSLEASGLAEIDVFSKIVRGELRFAAQILTEENAAQVLAVVRRLYEHFQKEGMVPKLQIISLYYSFAALCLENGFLGEDVSVKAAPRSVLKNSSSLYVQFVRYVGEHYAEAISIVDIARALNVSESGLYKACRNIQGYSPQEYILRYRLIRAAQMLKAGNEPVTEVGLSCGFGSISYFISKFKSSYGVTPHRYRKQNTDR